MADVTTDSVPPWAAGASARHDEVFPVLDAVEIEILGKYGEQRSLKAGETLWRIGDRDSGLVLVLSGAFEIVARGLKGERVIHIFRPGEFTGEIATMVGDGALVAGRAAEDCEVINVGPARVRELLVTEADLGAKVLMAFTLRRMRMVAEHLGEVGLIGDPDDRQVASLRTFLSRNGVPYEIYAAAENCRALTERGLSCAALPAVVCGDNVLSRPTLRQVAECLGIAGELTPGRVYDLAVIGAGSAGLAAAIYGASEGLSVIVLESCAPGGQAATSSRIENYLGFPTGISGQALLGRAYLQANKFGARVAVARGVTGMRRNGEGYDLAIDDVEALKARSVVLASGAIYRNANIEGLHDFEGAGVYYAATHIEGQLCRGAHVIVVGGGNSAGQAAVFLAGRARKVSIVVRGRGLADSMSDYLIRRIESLGNVELLTHTEIQCLEGDRRLGRVTLRNNKTGETQYVEAGHVFVFIGAQPATDFARDLLTLDEHGFVLTGDALDDDALRQAGWMLNRRPYLLESSAPGVFAAGDVRAGSVKRVAAAVGEGSACIQFVHRVLAERQAASAAA
jgi:thioredoxin reductase (NADPH)